MRPAIDLTRTRALAGPGWQISVVDETGSTNADLLQAAVDGAAHGTVLTAESQTSGRGRLDRSWVSPPRSGLIVSVLLRPQLPTARWAWLPLLTGVVVAEVLNDLGPIEPARLKWPNDVLIGPDAGKVAGILVQAAPDGDQLPGVVLGVGINVTTRRDELPLPTASSLVLAGIKEPDRSALLGNFLARLHVWLQRWQAAAGDAAACGLATEYRQHCTTLGTPVTVQLATSSVSGIAEDIDDGGSLLVRSDGDLHVVTAGDVTHLRPAS